MQDMEDEVLQELKLVQQQQCAPCTRLARPVSGQISGVAVMPRAKKVAE